MGEDADRNLLQAVSDALAPLAEVQSALLFGSRARGRARGDSDIDIAVLLDGTLAPADASARLKRLLEALSAEVAADCIDRVVLKEAPPALAFQVLKYGKSRSCEMRWRCTASASVRTVSTRTMSPWSGSSARSHAAGRWVRYDVVDAEILRRRIDVLLGYLGRLDRFASIARDEFVREPGVLDEELGKQLQGWVGLQSVLVHAYLAIDHGIAWNAIVHELSVLRRSVCR